MKLCISFALFAVTASPVHAFTFGIQKLVQNPSLPKFAEAQTGTMLDIQLDVGGIKDDQSRLSVNGLQVELQQDDANDANHPNMPGIHGPHPSLSSGTRALTVHRPGSFISMKGAQQVPLEHGCWELIWKDDVPAGKLVVGFDLATDVQRNAAKLPSGRIYMSFPVWTPEGLAEAQVEKFRIETKAGEYNTERIDHLHKYADESNILKKALHYRDAAAAMEKHMLLNTKLAESIPLDKDVLSIPPGLLLCNTGTVWSKKHSSTSFKDDSHVLLGTAILKSNKSGTLQP